MLCEQYGTHASVTIIFLCFWPHFMMTSSNSNIFALLAFCAGNSPVTGGFPWRGALMFSLVCAWVNGWANNQDADVLRRHHTSYDVTVMNVECDLLGFHHNVDSLMQDCSNSIANALELLQFSTKPSILLHFQPSISVALCASWQCRWSSQPVCWTSTTTDLTWPLRPGYKDSPMRFWNPYSVSDVTYGHQTQGEMATDDMQNHPLRMVSLTAYMDLEWTPRCLIQFLYRNMSEIICSKK